MAEEHDIMQETVRRLIRIVEGRNGDRGLIAKVEDIEKYLLGDAAAGREGLLQRFDRAERYRERRFWILLGVGAALTALAAFAANQGLQALQQLLLTLDVVRESVQ